MGALLGIKAMEILAALHVFVLGGRVDLDLVEELLRFIGKLAGALVASGQLQHYLGLILLQLRFREHERSLVEPFRFLHRIEPMRKRVQGLGSIAAGRPAAHLTFPLPELKFCGEVTDAHLSKSVIRQVDLAEKTVPALYLPDCSAIRKGVGQKGLGHHQGENAQRLEQFRRLDAVVELGQAIAVRGVPPQIEGRIAHNIVKAHLRLVGADIAKLQVGCRIKMMSYFIGFGVYLTAIDV